MRFILLGTAGYHPSAARHTAGIVLPELGLVFDAGTSLFRLRPHLKTKHLDIFLTHAHLDHVVGLTYFFSFLEGTGIETPRVHGEAAKLQAVREHLFAPELFPAPPPYSWHPLQEGTETINGAQVSWFPLEHPGGSIGYRVEAAGRSWAYVTDTEASPTAPYVEHIRGVDTLIHECNFRDDQIELARLTGHSRLVETARTAAAAGVKRLILTHFDPASAPYSFVDLKAAREHFPEIELGYDGLESSF